MWTGCGLWSISEGLYCVGLFCCVMTAMIGLFHDGYRWASWIRQGLIFDSRLALWFIWLAFHSWGLCTLCWMVFCVLRIRS